MASKKYTLSDENSGSRARVDDVSLVKGGDPVALTNDQVERLEQAGVVLDSGSESTSSSSSSSSSSGSSSSSSSGND